MTAQDTIAALIARITENCNRIDTDAAYDSMLDECYSFESVGGPFAYMCASTVLKEVDPTAYRCDKNDWIDEERFVEIDGDYYDSREVENERDAYVDELESELSDLESERDDLREELDQEQAEDEPDQEEVDRLTKEIDAKEKEMEEKEGEIQAAKAHTF